MASRRAAQVERCVDGICSSGFPVGGGPQGRLHTGDRAVGAAIDDKALPAFVSPYRATCHGSSRDPSPYSHIKQGPAILVSMVPKRPAYAVVPTARKPAAHAGPQAALHTPPSRGRILPASGC